MQVQLVVVNSDHTPPGVQRISDRLGYIPTAQARHSPLAFRTDAHWWKQVLHTLPLGTIVDSEVDTAEGPVESNDRMKIVNVLEAGGDVFYVTFARKISPHDSPVIFSIYRGGQLTFSMKDLNHIKDLGPLLPN